jgi:hypothetical protein
MNIKEETITPPGDDFAIRCPKLGHQIFFSYCLHENDKLPCFKTLDCWHTHFQVEKYLKEALTQNDWEAAFATPRKPKILTLVELIEQAKNSKKQEES